MWALAAAVAIGAIALVVLGTSRLPGDAVIPGRGAVNTSAYVTSWDGVDIAVDVWLPRTLAAGERAPTLVQATRYWRAVEVSPLARMGIALGLLSQDDAYPPMARYFNARGFAFVLVDVRGTGASQGLRETENSDAESRDIVSIAQWIRERDWSDRHVGLIGISYDGTAAELAIAKDPRAFDAAALLFSDFDAQLGLLQPGGVMNTYLRDWGQAVAALDRNDVCGASGDVGLSCFAARALYPGVKPVGGDRGRLQDIVSRRAPPRVAEQMAPIEYRDDLVSNAVTIGSLSPAGHLPELRRSRTPLFVQVGWHDAFTTDGALARYLLLPDVPQDVWIGPWTHGARGDGDPFRPPDEAMHPARDAQWARIADFFSAAFAGAPTRHGVEYCVLGTDACKTSDVWPPRGIQVRRYYAAAGDVLDDAKPNSSVSELFKVDFAASMGESTRVHTNFGGRDIVYANLAAPLSHSKAFTSPPLTQTFDIVGSPRVQLRLQTDVSDGAVHAYLEAVAPDGRVVYLTEGILRLAARAAGRAEDAAPYSESTLPRSFLRRDGAAMPRAQPVTVQIAMANVAARIPAGWRLRWRIAGADQPLYRRYPAGGEANWTLQLDADTYLDLPTMEP